jgi:hypothetical protein
LLAVTTTLRGSHRKATYRTLIGLLGATGMRVGEAIGLDRDDFDAICGALARTRPAELSLADSGPPTNFSPFWRHSDYAASFTAISASQAGLAALVGIIRSAA